MAEVYTVSADDLFPPIGPLDYAVGVAAMHLRVPEQAVRDAIELGKVLNCCQLEPLSMQVVDGYLYWTNGGTIYCTRIELPAIASGDCKITISWGRD